MRFSLPVYEEQPELNVISPLSPAEALALADSEAARAEVDGRIARLRERRCVRHLTCRKYTISAVRKDDPSRSFHRQADCGRLDCPACCRTWTIRQLVRTVNRLACESPGSTLPRQDQLYAYVGPADGWEALSRSIRRQSPNVGHVRVYRNDGTILVVSESSFRDSFPVSVLVGVSLVADAVESALRQKHVKRHIQAVRWLGSWSEVDASSDEWTVLQHKRSLVEVQALAVQIGAEATMKKGMLSVSFRDALAAARFWSALEARPDLPLCFKNHTRVNLDTGAFDPRDVFQDIPPPDRWEQLPAAA